MGGICLGDEETAWASLPSVCRGQRSLADIDPWLLCLHLVHEETLKGMAGVKCPVSVVC